LTGFDRAVGLRFGSEVSAEPLDGGRFFVSTGGRGYLIG